MTDRLFSLEQQIQRRKQQAQAGFSEANSYEEDDLQDNRLLALQQSLQDLLPFDHKGLDGKISKQLGQDNVKEKREDKQDKKGGDARPSFKVSGGTFVVLNYFEANLGAVCIGMKLQFIPHQSLREKGIQIGLIQTVLIKETLSNAKMMFGFADGGLHQYTHDKETGISIDRHADNNPVYGTTTGNTGKVLTDDTDPNSRAIASKKSFVATLQDEPNRDIIGKKKISMKFEVVALILAGKEAGTYLGSLSWGCEWEEGNGKIILDNITVSDTPSKGFFQAAAAWNNCGNAEKVCNNDDKKVVITDLVKIPIPDKNKDSEKKS